MRLILLAKYRGHPPLNLQSDIYTKEGIALEGSCWKHAFGMTLADWVGTCVATLMPLVTEIAIDVLAAERIHADETMVPGLAKSSGAVAGGQPKRRHECATGRLWAYVRDDQPFDGATAPAVLFHYSRDRGAEHPERHLAACSGIMQADD